MHISLTRKLTTVGLIVMLLLTSYVPARATTGTATPVEHPEREETPRTNVIRITDTGFDPETSTINWRFAEIL